MRFITASAAAVVASGLAWALADGPTHEPLEAPPPKRGAVAVAKPDGKELFTREWLPRDSRAHGGDGLGPVFNDTSCVACHNLGGVGGAGPKAKNVSIVTPMGGGTPNGIGPHPIGPSFVLHRFGTDAEFETWRRLHRLDSGLLQTLALTNSDSSRAMIQRASGSGTTEFSIPPEFGGRFNSITQRQTTALFGAGKLDQIPERAIIAAAERKFTDDPKITGRVSRLENGRIGRFGWKAQIAGLEEFVLTACAVELGLQVPGKDQPPLPHKKDYKAPGLDMNGAECDALVKFIRDLPAPRQQRPSHEAAAKYLAEGEKVFTAAGCVTCHVPKLGDVEGIYSDLLLHDMGHQLSDAGSSYGVFRPQPETPAKTPSAEVAEARQQPKAAQPVKEPPATAAEWRTPPLWGVRDSAPYLHDGRAETLQDAIAHHGGEAERSRQLYMALKFEEKQKLLAFLKNLVAP